MKSYKEINDEIQAAESLKHKTLMKMQEQKAPSHVWQKTLLIATAAVLLFIILPIQRHLATDSGSVRSCEFPDVGNAVGYLPGSV